MITICLCISFAIQSHRKPPDLYDIIIIAKEYGTRPKYGAPFSFAKNGEKYAIQTEKALRLPKLPQLNLRQILRKARKRNGKKLQRIWARQRKQPTLRQKLGKNSRGVFKETSALRGMQKRRSAYPRNACAPYKKACRRRNKRKGQPSSALLSVPFETARRTRGLFLTSRHTVGAVKISTAF